MKKSRTTVLCLIAVALFGGMAVAQDSVTPVSDCGNPQIQNVAVRAAVAQEKKNAQPSQPRPQFRMPCDGSKPSCGR